MRVEQNTKISFLWRILNLTSKQSITNTNLAVLELPYFWKEIINTQLLEHFTFQPQFLLCYQ